MSTVHGSHSFNSGHDPVLNASLADKMLRQHVILRGEATKLPEAIENCDCSLSTVEWLIKRTHLRSGEAYGITAMVTKEQMVKNASEEALSIITDTELFRLLASYKHPLFRGLIIVPVVQKDESLELYYLEGVGDTTGVRLCEALAGVQFRPQHQWLFVD